VLAQQFNSLSPGNELKWSSIEPQRDVFDFTNIDRLVGLAKTHDVAVKGHGLISGAFNPDWLTQVTDATQLRAVMAGHFGTIMDRYQRTVDRWDPALPQRHAAPSTTTTRDKTVKPKRTSMDQHPLTDRGWCPDLPMIMRRNHYFQLHQFVLSRLLVAPSSVAMVRTSGGQSAVP
jgi:hypothetical protein